MSRIQPDITGPACIQPPAIKVCVLLDCVSLSSTVATSPRVFAPHLPTGVLVAPGSGQEQALFPSGARSAQGRTACPHRGAQPMGSAEGLVLLGAARVMAAPVPAVVERRVPALPEPAAFCLAKVGGVNSRTGWEGIASWALGLHGLHWCVSLWDCFLPLVQEGIFIFFSLTLWLGR